MTLRESYQKATKRLETAGIEEASLDAWYLLEHVTGWTRAAYFADCDREMTEGQQSRYESLVEQRAGRIPLQHITGVQEFMGLEFVVNRHVLIPRQDTELLVETALEELCRKRPEDPRSAHRILDLCTGSGCILLSTLYHAKNKEHTLTYQGVGADISAEALRIAAINGDRLGLSVKWVESDLFAEIDDRFDMILSNPPYIPTAAIETLQPEVRDHDPRRALDGGTDGLCFYRDIIREGKEYLNPGGCLIFEIGSEQAEAVTSYLQACGYRNVTVRKDLAGLDRVVYAVYDTM